MRVSDPPSDKTVTFTLNGVRRGVVIALPLALSVVAYGVAFGLFARAAQMSMAEALLMSGLVFSGSAQMAAVSSMGGGSPPVGLAAVAVMTTVLLLNARYLLYGAAMRPWLGQTTPLQAYASLAVLGDANWVLSMKLHAEGECDAGVVFGSGVSMFLPWLAGTAIGVVAAGAAANPRALGLDFMLAAFSLALAVGMFGGRGQAPVIAAAIAAAVAADRWLPPGWSVVCAGLAGGAVGWISAGQDEQP